MLSKEELREKYKSGLSGFHCGVKCYLCGKDVRPGEFVFSLGWAKGELVYFCESEETFYRELKSELDKYYLEYERDYKNIIINLTEEAREEKIGSRWLKD